jgi:hypothetical protein
MQIKINNGITLLLDKCNSDSEKLYELVCPALIAATVRPGTILNVYDISNNSVSGIFADAIEKAGAKINILEIQSSQNLVRMIAKATIVRDSSSFDK